jgi:hypothetical protein
MGKKLRLGDTHTKKHVISVILKRKRENLGTEKEKQQSPFVMQI